MRDIGPRRRGINRRSFFAERETQRWWERHGRKGPFAGFELDLERRQDYSRAG
jgi:hypothetical protein